MRIVSITIILMMHIYALVHHGNGSLIAFNRWVGIVVNAIGNCGVSLFILISGYFGVQFKTSKFINLILLTIVYSLIVNLINDGVSKKAILESLLVVPAYKNWFIACYMGLLAFSPFINRLCEKMSSNLFIKFIVVGLIVLSILPIFTGSTVNNAILNNGGKCFTYFIYLYMVGRFLARVDFERLKSRQLILVFVTSTLTIIIIDQLIRLFLHHIGVFTRDCSPFILISSICMFIIVCKTRFHSPLVNHIAKSVFPIYLLHPVYYAINRHWIHLHEFSDKYTFTLVYLAFVTLLVIAIVIVDQIRIGMLGKYIDKLCDGIARILKKWLRPAFIKMKKRIASVLLENTENS